MARLRRRPRADQDESQRWFEVWKILFPDHDLPNDPCKWFPDAVLLPVALTNNRPFADVDEELDMKRHDDQVRREFASFLTGSLLEILRNLDSIDKQEQLDHVRGFLEQSCQYFHSTPPLPVPWPDKAGGVDPRSPSRPSPIPALSTARGKRPFSEQDDDDDALATDSKRARVSSPNGEAFACPYWKKDAQTYSSCYKFKFEDVRRVKQHLDKCHVKKIRCPRCQGKFETRISCDDHIRDVDCARQPKIMDEGIDQGQKDRLNKKGQASQSQFQRWYVVWRIVFPDIVEPVSPYNDDDGLGEVLRQEGPAIILGHMRQLPNWNQDDEDRFSQVPSRIILDIERQWVAQRAQGNGQTAAGGTADLPDKEPPTDLALDLSPSPSNSQGVHGTADGVNDGNNLDLPLFPGDVTLSGISGELSMLDGEHYLSTEDDPVPCDSWIWDDLNRSTFQ